MLSERNKILRSPLATVSQFVIPRHIRRGIQNDLISREFHGFPFDFAQGGELVEPRVSLDMILLARNDSSD